MTTPRGVNVSVARVRRPWWRRIMTAKWAQYIVPHILVAVVLVIAEVFFGAGAATGVVFVLFALTMVLLWFVTRRQRVRKIVLRTALRSYQRIPVGPVTTADLLQDLDWLQATTELSKGDHKAARKHIIRVMKNRPQTGERDLRPWFTEVLVSDHQGSRS